MPAVTPVDPSEGCECDYCCVLNGEDGTCSGRLWWKCDCPGGTLVLQKLTSSWVDQSVDLSSGSYTVTASGTFRMKCTLPTGEVYYSNQVTVTVCSNHSVWFRWHKQNTSTTVNLAIGSTLQSFGPPFNFDQIRSNLNGFTWAIIAGNPINLNSVVNGMYVTSPAHFPIAAGGCSTDNVTPVSGDLKVYSYENSSTQTRTGYTFDYRYLYEVPPGGCGTGHSIGVFFGRGLVNLGSVTITDRLQISFTEIATIPAAWSPSTGLYSTARMYASSGPNFISDDMGTHTADVSLWLPPFDVSPIVWHDGASTPSIPFDPTGNTLGLILSNRTTSSSVTGSKMSNCGVQLDIYNYVSLATNSVFTFERSVRSWAPTEKIIRSCSQANAGTNALPPSTVNPNDPCGIFGFAFPNSAGNACQP